VSDETRSPRDPGLEDFASAIEATMRTRRGVEHVLSPREFALVRSWYEAGVPLATVLVAIDLAFDADPSLASLALCRRRVEQLAAGATRSGGPSGHETGRPSLAELQERLKELRERLLVLPARAAALPLHEVEELDDLVSIASRPNWDYLGERLQRVDDLVSVAAVEALEMDELEALRAEAERAAERHRGRVEPRPLQEAVERLVRQRARERLQLPRVALA
jgi:hypothetical protein